jgi:hypothetical protein
MPRPRASAGALIVVAPTVATVARIASAFFITRLLNFNPEHQRGIFPMVANGTGGNRRLNRRPKFYRNETIASPLAF